MGGHGLDGVNDDMEGGAWDPYGYGQPFVAHPTAVQSTTRLDPRSLALVASRAVPAVPLGRFPDQGSIPNVGSGSITGTTGESLVPDGSSEALAAGGEKAAAPSSDNTALYVGIGVGVLGVAVAGWYLYTHPRRRRRRR